MVGWWKVNQLFVWLEAFCDRATEERGGIAP